jgi:hypothetical protein
MSNAQGHEGYEDNMIDDAIEDEFNENEQSFNPVSGSTVLHSSFSPFQRGSEH